MSGNEPLVLELMDLLGVENVITDDISLKVYECDGAEFFNALPDVVVFPDSAEEISKIVKNTGFTLSKVPFSEKLMIF